MIEPEWVKLIPADSIPVFCLNENVLDQDVIRIREQLADFFGDRKFLVIRSGDVQIYAIADHDSANITSSYGAVFYCGVKRGLCTRTDCIGAQCAFEKEDRERLQRLQS